MLVIEVYSPTTNLVLSKKNAEDRGKKKDVCLKFTKHASFTALVLHIIHSPLSAYVAFVQTKHNLQDSGVVPGEPVTN